MAMMITKIMTNAARSLFFGVMREVKTLKFAFCIYLSTEIAVEYSKFRQTARSSPRSFDLFGNGIGQFAGLFRVEHRHLPDATP